jgi:hypothetical protein
VPDVQSAEPEPSMELLPLPHMRQNVDAEGRLVSSHDAFLALVIGFCLIVIVLVAWTEW